MAERMVGTPVGEWLLLVDLLRLYFLYKWSRGPRVNLLIYIFEYLTDTSTVLRCDKQQLLLEPHNC
jgi:hypothetical protein